MQSIFSHMIDNEVVRAEAANIYATWFPLSPDLSFRDLLYSPFGFDGARDITPSAVNARAVIVCEEIDVVDDVLSKKSIPSDLDRVRAEVQKRRDMLMLYVNGTMSTTYPETVDMTEGAVRMRKHAVYYRMVDVREAYEALSELKRSHASRACRRNTSGGGEEFFEWVRRDLASCGAVTDVEYLTDDILLDALHALCGVWLGDVFDRDQMIAHCENAFGFAEDELDTLSPTKVHRHACREVLKIGHLLRLLNLRQLVDENDEEGLERRTQIGRMLHVVSYSRELLGRVVSARVYMNGERYAARDEVGFKETHFMYGKEDDLTPLQRVYKHALQLLGQRSYRKFGDECWAPKKVEIDGEVTNTHAWEQVCSVKDFVLEHVRKELNYDQWKNLTKHRKMADDVTAMLLEGKEFEFPELEFNRELFACRNGLYSLRHAFFPYDRRGEWAEIALQTQAVWNANGFGEVEVDAPDDADCAVMFIDEPFDETWADPNMLIADRGALRERVETLALDELLSSQVELTARDLEWLLALTGQAYRPKGWCGENWQVMLVLKGAAGTGKSTYLNLLLSFFPDVKVGTISSSSEETFGLVFARRTPSAHPRPAQRSQRTQRPGPSTLVALTARRKRSTTSGSTCGPRRRTSPASRSTTCSR